MPTKLLYSLSDENPDLQKQIGCMNGIFHIFDRHHFLSSRRFANHNQKRLPPGISDKHEIKPHSAPQRQPKDKNPKKTVKEKKRTSNESSRTSFSSSTCSSSFSSMDCNKQSQPEPSFPGTPTLDLPIYEPSVSPHFRHIVKDSMYREARGLPIKTATKENAGGQILKYMDSPRPVHLQPVKSGVSGLNESYRVLPLRKDGMMPKDAPRFSYDGRVSQDAFKSQVKVKELPRLSLDSKVRSMRGPNIHLLGDQQKGYGKTNNSFDQQQELASYKRPSSVVAKLMGLEAFPEPTLANGNQPDQMKTFSNVEYDSFETKQTRISGSPRNSRMEAVSPRTRNADSVKKTLATSKFPMETAPWRQPDANKCQTPASKSQETPIKAQNFSLSVYGEIEKRLAQLEFKKSGKDLRALKQILEAMQKTKEMSERRKDQASKVVSQTGNDSSVNQSSKFDVKRSNPSPTTFKGTTPTSFKSPIVIMKAAKSIEKAHNSVSSATVNRKEFPDKLTAKDQTSSRLLHFKNTDKNAEALTPAQTSKSPYPSTGKKKLVKCSEPMNLRVQQKKQSHPTTPSSDLCRARRHMAKSGSPQRKSTNSQQKGTQLYGISTDARDLCHQDDTTSLKSESNISMVSYIDSEVTSTDRSDKDPETWYTEDRSTVEPAKVGGEQPSPVSVLDAIFYRDEPPSPVKKISPVFKDEDVLISDEAEWRLRDSNHSFSFSSDNNYRNQNFMHLYPIHKDEIAFVNNSTKPDHQYISEILLASGLLRDVESGLMSFQLHPSGHMINPNLFLVLEQNKASTRILDAEHKDKKTIHSEIRIEKAQRKLIFDAVNEILVYKLSSNQWVFSNKLVGEVPRQQQLLKELCTKVDRLQAKNSNYNLDNEEDSLRSIIWEDLMHGSMDWTNCQSEISWLALDVERLIFKDLITDLVRDETAGRLCRQLFFK